MTCAACTSAVEGALRAVPGVVRAAVSLQAGEAEVVLDTARATPVSVTSFGGTRFWRQEGARVQGRGGGML